MELGQVLEGSWEPCTSSHLDQQSNHMLAEAADLQELELVLTGLSLRIVHDVELVFLHQAGDDHV